MAPNFARWFGRSLLLLALLAPQARAEGCLTPDDLRAGAIDRGFVQLRYIAGLSQPLRSEGRVRVTENRVSWHMTSPFDVETIITPDGLSQSVDGQPPTEVAGGGAFGGALVQALADLLRGRWEPLRAIFQITAGEVAAGQPWSLRLIPRDERLLALFAAIAVSGCRDVTGVEISHQGGDREVIEFLDGAP
jgi:hypothetical protein